MIWRRVFFCGCWAVLLDSLYKINAILLVTVMDYHRAFYGQTATHMREG